MYIYNMYVYAQVECEYLKKARGTVTATARYQLPADKQVHHKQKKKSKSSPESGSAAALTSSQG
jgi:hypothetical protein